MGETVSLTEQGRGLRRVVAPQRGDQAACHVARLWDNTTGTTRGASFPNALNTSSWILTARGHGMSQGRGTHCEAGTRPSALGADSWIRSPSPTHGPCGRQQSAGAAAHRNPRRPGRWRAAPAPCCSRCSSAALPPRPGSGRTCQRPRRRRARFEAARGEPGSSVSRRAQRLPHWAPGTDGRARSVSPAGWLVLHWVVGTLPPVMVGEGERRLGTRASGVPRIQQAPSSCDKRPGSSRCDPTCRRSAPPLPSRNRSGCRLRPSSSR